MDKLKNNTDILGTLITQNWSEVEGVFKRQYTSYDEYLAHQASKLEKIQGLEKQDKRYKAALTARIKNISSLNRVSSVLCLGARTGSECEAFANFGKFVVGVDLNPGQNNKYVVMGDFNNLQFADNSIDCVFTNALDHSLDLNDTLGQVKRVLKPGGLFISEIILGTDDHNGRGPGDYEAMWWRTFRQPVKIIEEFGFRQLEDYCFQYPWNGAGIVWRAPGHRPLSFFWNGLK
jgi:SAM-dependent methyltransferase